MVIDKEWEQISQGLVSRGYEVVYATSALALDFAIEHKPQLIVLGPDFKLCECLRDKTDIPMVMLADKLDKTGILRAISLGCTDLLDLADESVLQRIITHLRLSNIDALTKQLYKLIN
tara:strand:- start:2660 stop:3013 length:354 start_codon:yes stop_codon:yes gene_type:complete